MSQVLTKFAFEKKSNLISIFNRKSIFSHHQHTNQFTNRLIPDHPVKCHHVPITPSTVHTVVPQRRGQVNRPVELVLSHQKNKKLTHSPICWYRVWVLVLVWRRKRRARVVTCMGCAWNVAIKLSVKIAVVPQWIKFIIRDVLPVINVRLICKGNRSICWMGIRIVRRIIWCGFVVKILQKKIINNRLFFLEYPWKVLRLYETDFRSDFEGHWKTVPSKMFLLRDLWEKFGWYTVYCGCNESDSLHWRFSQVSQLNKS